MKLLSTLLASLNGFSVEGNTEIPISAIDYDSRSCNEYSLFVAIPGSTVPPIDGNTFIDHAISRGAKAIITNRSDLQLSKDITLICVPDTRDALSRVSNAFYDNPSKQLSIYGITGTNGKTTSTFLLKSILEAYGEPTGLIGTTGNFIGTERIASTHTTPESPQLCQLLAAMIRRGIKSVVMEVSSHALELKRVNGITFAGALFTNLTHDHLDFHGSMDNYAKAKKKLFDMLPKESIAMVMGDSPYSYLMLSETKSKKKYMVGRSRAFDIMIQHENHNLSGASYNLQFKGTLPEYHKGDIEIVSPLFGKFNVENTALCAAFARVLGIDDSTIKYALRSSDGAPGRMQRLRLPNGALALVDYAHSPDALEKALSTCRMVLNQAGRGRLTVVFGCGGERDETKRPKMGFIAASLADRIILTDDNPRNESSERILLEISNGISPELLSKVQQIPDRAQAITEAVSSSLDREIILIAGKGHEEYQIIHNNYLPFSDIGLITSLISTHFLPQDLGED